LEQRGVTDATGVKGGIVRLGVGAADGTYCHSHASMSSACRGSGGASTVSSLSLQVTQRKPFGTSGRINFRASLTLAHEMGHTFGM